MDFTETAVLGGSFGSHSQARKDVAVVDLAILPAKDTESGESL